MGYDCINVHLFLCIHVHVHVCIIEWNTYFAIPKVNRSDKILFSVIFHKKLNFVFEASNTMSFTHNVHVFIMLILLRCKFGQMSSLKKKNLSRLSCKVKQAYWPIAFPVRFYFIVLHVYSLCSPHPVSIIGRKQGDAGFLSLNSYYILTIFPWVVPLSGRDRLSCYEPIQIRCDV